MEVSGEKVKLYLDIDETQNKSKLEAKKAKEAMESAVKVALAAVVGAVQGAMGKIGECLAGVGNNASSTSNVDLRDTLNKPWANAGMDGTRIKSGYDVYMEKTYNNCKEKNPDASDSRIYAQIALRAPWEYKIDAIGNYLSNYNWFTSIPKKFALIEKGIFVNSAINNGFDPKTAEIYGNMAGDFSEGMLFETGFTIVGKGLKAASALKSGEVLSEGEIVAGSGIGNLKGIKGVTQARKIDIPKSVERQVKKLSPEARKSYDKAIEALKNSDTRGLHDHPVSGGRSGQRAIDIKVIGKGRGQGRIVYEINSDGGIDIIEILTKHDY